MTQAMTLYWPWPESQLLIAVPGENIEKSDCCLLPRHAISWHDCAGSTDLSLHMLLYPEMHGRDCHKNHTRK